jgi:RHS repeat-associated protein
MSLLAVGFFCCVGLFCSPALASGGGSPAAESSGLAGNPLVVPGAGLLVGAQQQEASEEARLRSPEAVRAREESETKFEALSPGEAAKLAGEAFPALIEDPAGGPPPLPAGESIVGFASDTSAELALPGGEHGALDSVAPLALETSPGHRSPIDLGLSEGEGSFRPSLTATGVRIPKHLGEGAALTLSGVSLTPVDAEGHALQGSEGAIDGHVVFYAGTGADMDTVIKPTSLGLEEDTLLRSVDSPRTLYYRVGLPAGATLSQGGESRPVEVIEGGQAVALILPPGARDAAGTNVPVSMSLSGDTLSLSVAESAGEYQYPIEVDPEVLEDTTLITGGGVETNWRHGATNESYKFHEIASGSGWLEDVFEGHHPGPEPEWYGTDAYETQGVSRIYEASAALYSSVLPFGAEAQHTSRWFLFDWSTRTIENEVKIPGYFNEERKTVCAAGGCSSANGSAENLVEYEQLFTKEGNDGFLTLLYQPVISIAQKEGPVTPSIDRADAWFYGNAAGQATSEFFSNAAPDSAQPGGRRQWTSPALGSALGVEATDPGIGIYKVRITSPQEYTEGEDKNPYREWSQPTAGCKHVQCVQSWQSPGNSEASHFYRAEYEPLNFPLFAHVKCGEGTCLHSWLKEGEDRVKVEVENAAGEQATVEETVKIDETAPENLTVAGLPASDEIGEGLYHVHTEASDSRSGIASMRVAVDGRPAGYPNGSCSTGSCTAKGEFVLNGAEYGPGEHTLTLTATSNAGNTTTKEYKLKIHSATPVSVGPGTVNPQSGNLHVSATDVALGAGLEVTRNYSSRHVLAGSGGPLGPQWTTSFGPAERLLKLPNGNVILAGAGEEAMFTAKGSGAFNSPPGDTNLALSEVKEGGSTEYVLSSPAAASTTRFATLHGGSPEVWVPSIQEGPAPADAVGYGYSPTEPEHSEYSVPAESRPWGITQGPDGNLWFTDYATGKVAKITTQGSVTEYALPAGSGPAGIAQGPDGNLWVAEDAIGKIAKITTQGTISEYALPSKEARPVNITPGPDGNLWVTEAGASKIAKITTSGAVTEYTLPAGSEPNVIAVGPDGNLWYTDYATSKIGKITTSGTITEYSLPAGSKLYGITAGPDGNLWFAAVGTSKIGKITTAGAVSEYSLPAESAPEGITEGPDGNLWFTETGTSKIGRITTSGQVSEYSLPAGSVPRHITQGPDGNLWYAEDGTSKIGKITTGGAKPVEALAAKPAGVEKCEGRPKEAGSHFDAGCRALFFEDAEHTSAHGEGQSEWGTYADDLEKIMFAAYNPATKKIEEKPVAEYAYDSQGRLRAEWDPRLEHPLKTLYSYDSEGHLTALTAPGQQPWALTYGAIAGDTNKGRLLKATRPSASTALWSGEVLASTSAPRLSGTAVVGVRMATTNGSWSGSPAGYAYQWEDCNSAGEACTPIAGATNQNYTPSQSDAGHTLVAQVTATNSGSSVAAASTASNEVQIRGVTAEYSVLAESKPWGITQGPDGKLWFTGLGTNKVGKITTSGTITEYALPSGSGPAGITQGPDGNLWVAEDSTSKIAKITTSGTITEYAQPAGSVPLNITPGPDGNLWFTEAGASKIAKITTSGSVTSYSLPAGSEPNVITEGPDGNLWYTDYATNKVGKITTSGTITEYSLPAGSKLYGITAGPDGNLWFAAVGTSKIGKITTSGAITEYSLPAESEPESITEGPDGNLWFSEPGTSKIGKITTSGQVTEYSLPAGSVPRHITQGPDGNLWYPEGGTSKIGRMSPYPYTGSTPTEGESHTPQPGSTIDYGVPVSGSGAPHEMSTAELEKWAQKDDPVEATAIFPPDEPQSWPATDYRRATVTYLDSQGHAVNLAAPTGGISTSEYNANNDVIRTLSADNRAAAIKEGSKSAEVAEHLSTKSEYNTEGTELLETLGPEHKVKIAAGAEAGKEVQARSHTIYHYDEGAPSKGGPYRLPTKVTQGAKLSGGEEADIRETVTSYSGQEELGWKLRKPTAVTTEPNGLDLKHETLYEESTGNVIETKTPGGTTKAEPPVYASTLGSYGSGNGQLNSPEGVAMAANGDLWIADTNNHRVEELSPSGSYVTKFGSFGTGEGEFSEPKWVAVNSKGQVWVSDEANSTLQVFNENGEFVMKVGSKGSGNGQFERPLGVAIDSHNNVWVADLEHGRLVEFNEKGEHLRTAGSKGTGTGQLEDPFGVAVDSHNDVWVADYESDRVEEYNEKGEYVRQFGSKGSGQGQFKEPKGIAISPAGNVLVIDTGNDRVQTFSPSGEYIDQFGGAGTGAGQVKEPRGIAINSSGDAYVADTANDRIQEWRPAKQAVHDTQTIYYSAGENASHPTCGKHPEWANLPCETKPAAQPETSGLPALAETTINAYNIWDEPEKATASVGTATRTTAASYDAAGRPLSTATSSSEGTETAPPTVTNEYSTQTGALAKQSTSEASLTSKFNTLGELESYTDAYGKTTNYEYDQDGRMTKISNEKGTDSDSYSETSGLPTKLEDSAAGSNMTFTASYGPEGEQQSEGLPDGLVASYSYNAAGERTSLQYKKGESTWFSDSVSPSIHGQWLSQESSLSVETYTYDGAGRLTQVQDTPKGKGCTTRSYGYDEETDRLSLASYPPTSEGKCQSSEGAVVENHAYDEADRLIDNGTAYNTFGDIEKMPAQDAGGPEGGQELVSSFFADGQLHEQSQKVKSGEGLKLQTVGYKLDPAMRTSLITSTGPVTATEEQHYAGPGSAPAWTSELSGQYTRLIAGISGGLAAIQHDSEEPILQLPNLHGDIVATAYRSESATKPASEADTTEFGVPATEVPPKYSWLGFHEIPTELPSGTIDMGARSYVPQLGRFLQPDPVPGGSANAYTYTYGNPVNEFDQSGEMTGDLTEHEIAGAELMAGNVAREIALEEAARREAEAKARMEAEMAGVATEGPEEEWYEEEEGSYGYEYASNHQGSESGKPEAHVEAAVLYQPLQESGGELEAKAKAALRLCQDAAGGAGKVEACARYASIFGKIGHWVDKHIVKPVEHFVHEIVTNLPKCYPNEIEGGGQCSSAPPGYGDDPFYPVF